MQLINPNTSPNELNTTLTPHSIIHGDACFAYFNKIWGIPLVRCSVNNVLSEPQGETLNVQPRRLTSLLEIRESCTLPPAAPGIETIRAQCLVGLNPS